MPPVTTTRATARCHGAPIPAISTAMVAYHDIEAPYGNERARISRNNANTSQTHHGPLSEANAPLNTQEDGADLQNGIDAGDPLTTKGRIKKRQRDKDSFDPDDPDRYRYKAYHIRRAFDLFGHIPTIINDGIKRRAKEAAGEPAGHIQSDRDFETFNLILNHLDGLNEDIVRLKRHPKEFRSLIRKIREAADQARNNDTANLKKDIACMLTPDGSSVLTVLAKGKKASSKHDRGYENLVMGRYLCPISLDWDDAEVRKEIQEGKHAVVACDWPRLLYANCECDLDDLELGLGRNIALVRVVKYLFTGRSAAFSDTAGGKTTRSGNAALAGMKEITPRVVAYAACMLRYAISNEESWSIMDNEFSLQEFYWHVVSIFDDSDEFGRELLSWWNMKVFGTSLETTMQSTTPTATVAISLLKSQRAAKRAANRILADVSNSQSISRSLRNSIESEDDDNIFGSSTRLPSSAVHDPPSQSLTERPLYHDVPTSTQSTQEPRLLSRDDENTHPASSIHLSAYSHSSNRRLATTLPPASDEIASSSSRYLGTNHTPRSPSTVSGRSVGPPLAPQSQHPRHLTGSNVATPFSAHSGVPARPQHTPTRMYASHYPPLPPWHCWQYSNAHGASTSLDTLATISSIASGGGKP